MFKSLVSLVSLKNELAMMPEYHLKTVAVKSYGLTNKIASKMLKKQLIEYMIGVEYKNAYR